MPNLSFREFLFSNKPVIAVITALGMIGGFMVGRAILSMSMLLFGINALWGVPPRDWLKQKWWWLGLLWVGIYIISFFWSDNIPYWSERVQVKIPFFFLPLAFALLPKFSLRHLQAFTIAVMVLLFAGCLYSLSFLWRDAATIWDGYFMSKVMPTPAYKDHIRYSIFVAWFVIWCVYIFPALENKLLKIITTIGVMFFIAYLHILAVKSGLIIFYLFVAMIIIYLLLKRKWLKGLLLFAGVAAVCYTAFIITPSFRHKFNYLKYTYEEYERGSISGNFSDMGRLISYKLALKVYESKPLAGVGAGDMLDDMKQAYAEEYPQVPVEQQLIPHNQLLVVLLAGGIPAFVLFIYWLFYPLSRLKKSRSSYFVLVTWAVLFVAFLVEPMLEVQFGVFVYLFCFLWMQKNSDVSLDITSPPTLSEG